VTNGAGDRDTAASASGSVDVAARSPRGAIAVVPSLNDFDAGEDGDVSHNLAGQRLGRKGRDTRERILLAASRLLYCDPGNTPLSLSAVAREASLGMTSLYNYFSDLTEVLLAILDPVMASAEVVYLGALRARWSDAELGERADEFVSNYHAFWKKHSRLLHLRNAMSDQRNPRMTHQRIKSTQPIIALLAEQMDGDPRALRSPAFAMATVLMIGIERSTTISTDDELPVKMAQDIQHDDTYFIHPCARLMEIAIRDVRETAALTCSG
jgi:AcrR family transcriptional regulator